MIRELINSKLIELDSITDKETGKPTIPVSIAIQEAEDVFGWCTLDKDVLISAGLDWKFAEDLPLRIDAMKVSQANWKTEFKTWQDCQEEWKIASPAAFDLRDELVHYFYHAFHNNQEEYAMVQRIAEGTKIADMIQALLELSTLGMKHTAELEAIGLDLRLLDAAKAKSFELGKLKTKVNIARKGTSPLLKIRDKAYTHLKEAVDEIRRIGQFYFWRDEDSFDRYVSQYNRKLNQARKKSDEQPEA